MITDLPPELLIIIFSYLGFWETYTTAIYTTKYFHQVCENLHFWKWQCELFLQNTQLQESLPSLFNKHNNSWKNVFLSLWQEHVKHFYFLDCNREDIKKHFRLGKKLGSGNFSIVRQCVDLKSGVNRAVKIIDKSDLEVMILDYNELNRFFKLKKLFIDFERTFCEEKSTVAGLVKVHDIFETKEKMYIIEDLVQGGEFFDRIIHEFPDGYSEHEASKYFKKLTRTVMFLHSKGFCRLQIQPQRIMFSDDEYEVKFRDFFHISKVLFIQEICGASYYFTCCFAPEIIRNQKSGAECDLWSLGVILYILLCGFPPFYSECRPELLDQIICGAFDFPSPYFDDVSKQAKDLVKKLIVVDPKKRYSASQVLKHPWICGKNQEKEVNQWRMNELKKFNARRKIREMSRYPPKKFIRPINRTRLFKKKK